MSKNNYRFLDTYIYIYLERVIINTIIKNKKNRNIYLFYRESI